MNSHKKSRSLSRIILLFTATTLLINTTYITQAAEPKKQSWDKRAFGEVKETFSERIVGTLKNLAGKAKNQIHSGLREMRIKQQDRRYSKLPNILKELPKPRFYGEKKAKITLIGWGSVKGPVLEAMKALPEDKFNFIHFTTVAPIDSEAVKKMLKDSDNIWLIESNKTGQFGDLLKQNLDIEFDEKILKYTGIPFFPEELIAKFK